MNVNYLELANHPLMWLAAAIAISVVILQSVIFIRKSLAAAAEEGITNKQIKMAVKSSVIASIGPAIVILVTMISLIGGKPMNILDYAASVPGFLDASVLHWLC